MDTDGDGYNDYVEFHDSDHSPLIYEKRYSLFEISREVVLGAVFGEWKADVYTAEKAPEQLKAPSKIKKPAKKLELPSSEYETKGSVMIFDREGSGSLEAFGTQNEFEDYIEKVKSLGDFPVLSSLMELYATEGLQEPEPLIEECERLLSSMDVEREMKEKTKLILAVAMDAQEAGSTVMLYFDPEV